MTTHVRAHSIDQSAVAASAGQEQQHVKLTTTIGRTYHFESAHRLPLLPVTHKCHHLHGHNYRMIVTLTGEVDSRGFVLDFAELDAIIMPLIAMVDHKFLNDVDGLENPTAEVIAAWFYERIGCCDRVRVYENYECWAEVAK